MALESLPNPIINPLIVTLKYDKATNLHIWKEKLSTEPLKTNKLTLIM